MSTPDEIIVRGKGMMDGSVNLEEAASALRAEADYLDQLRENGWELTDAVADDYVMIEKSGD